jgi:hypothetical protein
METTTLTDRYIAAAMRTVPEAQRADLAAELRGSIDDQIDARVEDGDERDAAEYAVLTELGDPEKLAAGYTDRPLWLIGPRHYLDWWRLLTLLLWIVLPCAAFGVALAKVLAGAAVGETIGAVVVTLLGVTVNLGFWTTLVFALVERSKVALPRVPSVATPPGFGLGRVRAPGLMGEWTPDHLPEPRPKGAGFGEMVASLVFLAAVAGAVLWDLFIGFIPSEPGLSFFDPGLWPGGITVLFALMAIEGALAVAVYAVGRWTIGFAVGNAVLAIAFSAPALWLLVNDALINPAYFPTLIPDGGGEVGAIVTTVSGFAIAALALWDIVDAFLKALRARRA